MDQWRLIPSWSTLGQIIINVLWIIRCQAITWTNADILSMGKKFQWNFNLNIKPPIFQPRKCIWKKHHLQNVGNFVNLLVLSFQRRYYLMPNCLVATSIDFTPDETFYVHHLPKQPSATGASFDLQGNWLSLVLRGLSRSHQPFWIMRVQWKSVWNHQWSKRRFLFGFVVDTMPADGVILLGHLQNARYRDD